MIAETSGRQLVALARAALEARVRGERPPAVPPELDIPTSGLFVTIHCGGSLRGCLGTIEPCERLGEALVRLAADVAHEDHRFAAIAPGELADVRVSVSLLTAAEQVTDPSTIEVGRDGLIVEQGRRRGLLLPQVASEHGWDREMLLSQTCIKAGLAPDAWQKGATVLRFEAEAFGEK